MSEFEAYRGLFVAESRENHENLVRNLLLLELGTDKNVIDEIFRSIHTLKGASASMGFSNMEHLCHSMEDVFQLIRSGTAEISMEMVNLLLSCSDIIEQMLDDIEAGGDSSSINPVEQVNALKVWTDHLDGKPKVHKEVPARLEEQPKVPAGDTNTEKIAENCIEYEMSITVARECIMKDVRAMIALGNLKSLGTILSLTPTMEAIDEGKFDGRVELIIASDAGEEAIKTAAAGTEIAEVVIHPVKKAVIMTPGEIVISEEIPGLKKDRTGIKKNPRPRTKAGRSKISVSISISLTIS